MKLCVIPTKKSDGFRYYFIFLSEGLKKISVSYKERDFRKATSTPLKYFFYFSSFKSSIEMWRKPKPHHLVDLNSKSFQRFKKYSSLNVNEVKRFKLNYTSSQ